MCGWQDRLIRTSVRVLGQTCCGDPTSGCRAPVHPLSGTNKRTALQVPQLVMAIIALLQRNTHAEPLPHACRKSHHAGRVESRQDCQNNRAITVQHTRPAAHQARPEPNPHDQRPSRDSRVGSRSPTKHLECQTRRTESGRSKRKVAVVLGRHQPYSHAAKVTREHGEDHC